MTVRTGFGSNVVRPGAYGQAVSIQLFRVTGAPVLHDNGTTGATQALHGLPHDRRGGTIPSERDDYLTGETYAPLLRAAGARFPSKGDFGFPETASVDPNHARLKGRYLRWDLEGASEIVLEPGGVYAFLILIDEIGEERGFTLANSYRGDYEGGHGIRRDGNGAFPPVPADPARPFDDPANAAALAAAHFPADMAARTAIAPGTDGYPDVDTWRDLTFWVEVAPAPSLPTSR